MPTKPAFPEEEFQTWLPMRAPQPATSSAVNGSEQAIGGTSAVSPLFTAMMMRVNGALGHSSGFINPFIYKNGNSGIFHDITSGNINGYDAATGWGSPDGQKFLDLLRKQ